VICRTTPWEGSLYLAIRHFAGSIRHFAGWYMVNELEMSSEDVAITLGRQDGGNLVRRLYGHRDKGARPCTRPHGMGAETKSRYRFDERVLWLRASAQKLLASVLRRRLPAQVVVTMSTAMPIPTAKQSPATSR
jgi:hypothetical protein